MNALRDRISILVMLVTVISIASIHMLIVIAHTHSMVLVYRIVPLTQKGIYLTIIYHRHTCHDIPAKNIVVVLHCDKVHSGLVRIHFELVSSYALCPFNISRTLLINTSSVVSFSSPPFLFIVNTSRVTELGIDLLGLIRMPMKFCGSKELLYSDYYSIVHELHELECVNKPANLVRLHIPKKGVVYCIRFRDIAIALTPYVSTSSEAHYLTLLKERILKFIAKPFRRLTELVPLELLTELSNRTVSFRAVVSALQEINSSKSLKILLFRPSLHAKARVVVLLHKTGLHCMAAVALPPWPGAVMFYDYRTGILVASIYAPLTLIFPLSHVIVIPSSALEALVLVKASGVPSPQTAMSATLRAGKVIGTNAVLWISIAVAVLIVIAVVYVKLLRAKH